ncbi:hypothetical protein BH10PLA2_BH10PLA2_36460 [soil metagenome]
MARICQDLNEVNAAFVQDNQQLSNADYSKRSWEPEQVRMGKNVSTSGRRRSQKTFASLPWRR